MDLDEVADAAMVAERMATLDAIEGIRVGDWVRFADGTMRRVSHHWGEEYGVQTSDGGSFYLGDGYVSFSGSLHPTVPLDSLTPTDEMADGWVWVFHHDMHRAHNGVDVLVPFRVFTCSLEANK